MAMDRDADDVEAANVASVLADQRVKEALASRPIGSRTCGSSSQYQFDADEFCACRYLVAHNNDADAAAAALAATLRWRQEARPAEIECAACLRDPHSHSLRVCGWDGSGRAVMYTCFSQATHRFNPEENTQHLTRTLEDACAIMASRSHISSRTDFEDASGGTTGAAVKVAGAESCIWVVDFHGYSMYSDSNPRTAVLASELLAHYPQRLHRAVLVDAPRVFSATWAALKMVINSVTASKVVFARTGDGSLEAELESWGPLSHAVRQWLLAEIASNREHTAANGRKRYWETAVALTAEQIAQLGTARRKQHDPRGTLEFVTSPEYGLTFAGRHLSKMTPVALPEAATTRHGNVDTGEGRQHGD